MQIGTGARGALAELKRLLVDERGFLRLYLSPDSENGGGAPDDDSGADDAPDKPTATPATEPDGGQRVENPEAKRHAEDAKKQRLARKAEREARETAEREKAELQAKLDRLTKALDPNADVGDDADKAIQAAQERAQETERKAKDALRREAFSSHAIAQGLNPERVREAYRLADFDGVEVDLDTGEVDGIESAAQDVLTKYPEWSVKNRSNRTPPPPVDNGAPGGNSDSSIDLNKLKPGDWSKLPEATKRQLLDEGITFVEPPQFPGDEPRRIHFQTGGNSASQRIRSHMKGSDPLIGDVTGVGAMGSAKKD